METNATEREMRDGTLTLRVVDEGASCTLRLSGELDLANAKTLTGALKQAESRGDGPLWIDMSELEFIDSTGIAILVAVNRRLEGSDRLRLVQSRSSAVRRVMSLTGLEAALPFRPAPG